MLSKDTSKVSFGAFNMYLLAVFLQVANKTKGNSAKY